MCKILSIWKLNNTVIDNLSFKAEDSRKLKKYFEPSKNKYTIFQN